MYDNHIAPSNYIILLGMKSNLLPLLMSDSSSTSKSPDILDYASLPKDSNSRTLHYSLDLGIQLRRLQNQ